MSTHLLDRGASGTEELPHALDYQLLGEGSYVCQRNKFLFVQTSVSCVFCFLRLEAAQPLSPVPLACTWKGQFG